MFLSCFSFSLLGLIFPYIFFSFADILQACTTLSFYHVLVKKVTCMILLYLLIRSVYVSLIHSTS